MKSKSKKQNAVKQKKIILTIRATEQTEIKTLNELKEATNEKTYAGALMKAASGYKITDAAIKLLNDKNNRLSNELDKIKSTLSNWLSSTREIGEVAKGIKQTHRPYRTIDE